MNILTGYSERSDGSMYLSAEGFDSENVANRRQYFDRIGAKEMKIVAAGLVHGTGVGFVDADTPAYLPETDALVTAEQDMLLTLTGADCFPLFFRDEEAGVVGLAHAGWRGIAAGIVEATVEALVRLGAEPGRIRLRMGPGICRKCFEVGEEVARVFLDIPGAVVWEEGVIRIDLPAVIRYRAARAGILLGWISGPEACTSCLPERYFSYRRDQPDVLETQVAFIGIRKSA
jgi:YfiH family protein